jgi:DUF1680 family protein
LKRGRPSRRTFLKLAAAGAAGLALPARLRAAAPAAIPERAEPLPLEAVRLLPSPFLDAVEGNRGFLHRVEPDRLLHNFRKHAGLVPRAAAYGGWEGDTIAGHSLGHYLSGCSLMYAQTGDPTCRERVLYIARELRLCQQASGDGYVAGFTRKRDGQIEDGKLLFAELLRGDIRAAGFDLNGCWVPFYNWHKLFAGLFDAQRYCGSEAALAVAASLAGYIGGIFDKLDDAAVQKVLDCEHGGINESFAELYHRTGDKRWLALAERLRHKKVLDPLSAGEDVLPHLHANTQIPKILGLARLSELGGPAGHAAAARFFWDKVTREQTYVIGGNADREYFQAPNSISKHITEQTCESCNTYNMLKLTRHLYGWRPDASFFDYYERAHFNHILAQQNPATGMFAYMVPLMSGSAREFSSQDNDFWCCVGTGMESHAKHGDSIFWRHDDHLLVNLYIPSRLAWKEKGVELELATEYPYGKSIELKVTAASPQELAISLRVPAYCENPRLLLNGDAQEVRRDRGYLTLRRVFAAGDVLRLELPRTLRLEPTPDDPGVVALLDGPLVLAADLGPAAEPFDGVEPALVGEKLLGDLVPVAGEKSSFKAASIGRPGALHFKPFFSQYGRRTAVYFRRFDQQAWRRRLAEVESAEKARRELDARSVDFVVLGEEKSEQEHRLESKISYPVSYRRRPGRDARTGGFFEFSFKAAEGPLELQATYWGEERRRHFHILVDGLKIASQKLDGEVPGEFIVRSYPLPAELTRGKSDLRVRFDPEPGHTAGPVFGCRLLRAWDPSLPS